MLLNFDILQETISYLDGGRDEDTLRSLALTCHGLSNLALDTIWRKKEALRNITSVVNSLAPSPNEPFLCYTVNRVNDIGGDLAIGSWVSFSRLYLPQR